ncbi:MAG: diacylglycerol kinase [Rhizobiaceae bacterium]|nr:diacylglycerol kinase [Rhizobiaceae bacterium]
MERLIKAWHNSVRAFSWLAGHEKAFQQELFLLVAALPLAWFLAETWTMWFVLVGSILVLMLVEVLNTAIEAACDAVSLEFHRQIQIAKDCGSLAVLIAIVLVAGVWLLAIIERF